MSTTADPAARATNAEQTADDYAPPDDCLACPPGCGSCCKDETCCECYEHEHPDDQAAMETLAVPQGALDDARAELVAAWPDLAADPVYVEQVTAVALRAAVPEIEAEVRAAVAQELLRLANSGLFHSAEIDAALTWSAALVAYRSATRRAGALEEGLETVTDSEPVRHDRPTPTRDDAG